MLRVVEVHRTAEGGWELVEGAPKPLHTVDAGGSDSASVAAIPAFLPLAALFAECLQQDSQMDAVVEVANIGTQPLSQPGAAQAMVEISPPAASLAAPAAGEQQTQASPHRLASAAAGSLQLQAQQQASGSQLAVEQSGSETQPDVPACGLLRQLSQVPATPSDPNDHVEATEDGEPAGMDLRAVAADGTVAIATTAAAAAARTPLLVTPASHAQHPAEQAEHARHAALPAPQQLQFVPETAAELLPGSFQCDAGGLPCVVGTAADAVPPQFVPETAAELPSAVGVASLGLHYQQQPGHERGAYQQRQPGHVGLEPAAKAPPPEFAFAPAADLLPASSTRPQPQQHQQQFVPEPAVDLHGEVPALPQQEAQQAVAQRARLPAFVPETASELAPLRHLFVTAAASPADLPPASAADKVAALALLDGLAAAPGGMLPLAAVPLGQPPAGVAGPLAQGQRCEAMLPPQPSVLQSQAEPVQQPDLRRQAEQQPTVDGGLQDFDFVVEVPTSAAGPAACDASPGGAGTFDYDAGPSQPSPAPTARPQAYWPGAGPQQQPQPYQHGSWQPRPAGHQPRWGDPPGQPLAASRAQPAPMPAAQPAPHALRPPGPQPQQWRPPFPPQHQPWRPQHQQAAPHPPERQPGCWPVGPFPTGPFRHPPHHQQPLAGPKALQGLISPQPTPGALPMQQPLHAAERMQQRSAPPAQPPPAGPLQPAGAARSGVGASTAAAAAQQAQQVQQAERPRKRVSLLDRPQGTFKPVRAAANDGGVMPAGTAAAGPPTVRPAAAAGESGEAKRRRIQAFQAELASILEVEPDRPAHTGAPAGGSGFGGFGPAAAARATEGKEHRKARVAAELEAELFGQRCGAGSSASGRAAVGGLGRGGGASVPQPSWRPPLPPHQAQGSRQAQQLLQQQSGLGPLQQERQQQAWKPPPVPSRQQHHRQLALAVQQQGQKQEARPQPQQETREQGEDVMAGAAPGAFVTAGGRQAWRMGTGGQERLAALLKELQGDAEQAAGQAAPATDATLAGARQVPRQAQQAQQAQPAQQLQEPAFAEHDGADVMADVAPGAFVVAGRKQAWRTGAADPGRLTALIQDLQTNQQEAALPPPGPSPEAAAADPPYRTAACAGGESPPPPPPPQQQQQQQAEGAPTGDAPGSTGAAGGGGAGQADEAAAAPVLLPATAVAEPELPPVMPATAVADLAEHAQRELLGIGQPTEVEVAPAQQPAILPATAPAEPESGPAESGSLGPSAEPMSLETARQLAEVEAAALSDRQQQHHQHQPESSALKPNCTAELVDLSMAPFPGIKRAREGETEAQPSAASPAAKQQRQDGATSLAGNAADTEAPTQAAGMEIVLEAAPAEAAQEDELQVQEAQPAQARQQAQQPRAVEQQVEMPMFSTGNGGSVTISAAKLQAAQALFGGAAGAADGQQQAAPPQAPQVQQAAGGQVDMPMFSTGNGGSVTISVAKLQAAQALFGDSGGGGCENEDANERRHTEQAAGGESTPVLRKQLLRSRVAEESSRADSPAGIAAAASGSGIATPTGAGGVGGGTTPASAPLPGRGKAAGLSRFAPAATTGQLKKKKGRRPFVTPLAGGGSGRKFKPPTMATPGDAGASRLGGSGSAGATSKPAAQLHDLQGSLLKRLLSTRTAAMPAGASGGADAGAAGSSATAEAKSAAAGPAGRTRGAGAAALLPLDSLQCTEFRIPDLLPPASSAGAATKAAASRPPPADAAITAAAGAPPPAVESSELNVQHQQQVVEALANAAPAALLGWRELRQRLITVGANPLYATENWVKNHYRWVVWKLARLQLLLAGSLHADSSGSGAAGSPSSSGSSARALLAAPVVLDELQYRYEREFNRGHRPLLKAVLQHDEVASAAMVLMVASVHLPPGAADGGGGDSTGTASAATLELTDGWYWIRAACDDRLTQLARIGRIRQGDKLRICGAELTSPGPGDPLEAASTAVLRISANSAHPAPAGARLGRLRRRSVFLPLGLLEGGGGPLPQTLVVVHRVFPRLVYCAYPNGSSGIMTPRQYDAMLADQEGMQQRLAAEAAAEVQRQELQQCRQWLQHGKRGGMSQFDRIYAQHVAQQAGEGGGGGDEGGILSQLSDADRRDMQRYMEQRQGRLLAQQEGWLQERRQATGTLPERTQELLQIEVGEVCHASVLDTRPGGRQAWRPAVATISMWGCAEELAAELREGAVFKVTHLVPQKHKPRPGLALKGTKSTRWTLYAPNPAALPSGLLCQTKHRQHLGLAGLAGCPLGTALDYTGQLLGLSRPLQGQGVHKTFQWLFFVDHTLSQQAQQAQQEQQQEQSGREPAASPRATKRDDEAGAAEAEAASQEAAAAAAAVTRAAIAAALAAAAALEGHTATPPAEAASMPSGVGQAPHAADHAKAPTNAAAAPGLAQQSQATGFAAPAAGVPAAPAEPATAAPAAGAAPGAAGVPWLLAVRMAGKASQLDWLDPSDVGSIFTIRDLTLEGADRQAHLWHAFGTECSAVHRHKAASLAAAAAARSRAAVPSAARGTSDGASCAELAAAAAAEVAAWAGANAGLVQQLLARIQAVLR